MKYLRLVSDIHLDFDVNLFYKTRTFNVTDPNHLEHFENCKKWQEMAMLWFPEPMDGDEETALMIAGDLWIERKFLTRRYPEPNTLHQDQDSWMKKLSERFKYVVFVLGNHDYWDTNILYEADKVRKEIAEQKLENVFFLEKDHVILDQVKIVGGTLWTDFNRGNPLVMSSAETLMNDYNFIRTGRDYRKVNPNVIYERHVNTKKYIFEHAYRDHPDQKVVVMTHMAPSYESMKFEIRTSHDYYSNFNYFSDLEERIRADGKDIDYWLHGHVHRATEYVLSPNVKVFCNPRGYAGEQTGFNPFFRISL